MKKSHRILGLAAALLVTAASLTLSGCGSEASPDDDVTIEDEGLVYLSQNSLFSYTLDDKNNATLITYNGSAASAVINRIDGRYPVVAIATGAFAGNENIEKVELGESVRAIGEGAFYKCAALKTVELRGTPTLALIEQNAFAECTNLESFLLPASLKTIGDEAFSQCLKAKIDFSKATGLTSIGDYAFSYCGASASENFTVTLPDNLEKIGTGAFYGTYTVDGFEVSEKNPHYSDLDGILYNKNGDTLVLYPGAMGIGEEFSVPAGVKRIAGGAFAGAGVTKIILPEGFTDIGGSAFYDAYAMESIVLPETIRSIGSFAFLECASLKEIAIPDGTSLGSYLFRSCTALTKVTLPADLTEIPDGLFDSCTRLAEITIPENVTVIGEFAFNYCSSLPTIELPASVTTVKSYALRNTGISEIDLSHVTDLGNFALQYCRKLTRADISGVSEIPAYLFQGNSLLTDVVFSRDIVKIGDYAFSACDRLKSFEIPASVSEIGGYAFSECASMAQMTVPASVTTLGEGIFQASGVESVTIEAPISSLPAATFNSCKKLTDLTLPAALEHIGMGAFQNCVVLESISLASPVKTVGAGAFNGCRKLTTLIFGTEDTEIRSATYYGMDALREILIPEGIEHIGMGAFGQCVFVESISLPSTLKTIEENAFAGLSKLTSVTVPEGVTSIGRGAFSSCNRLDNVEIPRSVVYVGEDVFTGTAWLRRQEGDFLIVGDGVLAQYLGSGATHIVIPDGVKRIPDFRFAGLSTEPTTFTIPASVEYIGWDAFAKLVSSSSDDSASYKPRYVTIIGEKGSYAESYARYEYYTFKEQK